MTDSSYNGWKNYETWAVNMYLDGNYTGAADYQHVAHTVRETLALDHPTSEYWTAEESRRYNVADVLKEWVEESTDTDEGGNGNNLHPLIGDMFGAALAAVDWYALADAWIDNVREQVTS